MSWQFPGGMSRGGEPYDTVERTRGDDIDDMADRYDGDDDWTPDDYDAYADTDSGRWRWVAGVAGAVLLVALVATWVILKGGDGASTAARVVPPQDRPTLSAPAASPSALPPTTALPPETVTTLTPSTTSAEADVPPTSTESAPPPPAAVNPRTIVYRVTGSKQPFDPVTVTYTDGTGALRTDFDVSLPWSKTVVVDPNVALNSVTAVSLASHLSCTISNADGQTVVSQSYNTIATTCNH